MSRRLTGDLGLIEAVERRIASNRSGKRALIIFGDTTGLHAEEEKAALENMLKSLYGPNVWFYSDHSASDAIEEIKQDFEVCHFVGHGMVNEPGDSGWKFSDGSILTPEKVDAVSSRASFPILIFGNSCSSARSSPPSTQGSISSLYRAFLRQGAAHYIGSIGPIPDSESRLFSECFYRSLSVGNTVGESVRHARQELRRRAIFPVWAYYVHYGDPTHRLTTQGTRPRFVFDVARPSAQTTDGSEQLSRLTSACIGREKELERANRQLAGLKQGHFSSIVILGETGTGKTLLMGQILADIWNETRGLVTAMAVANQRFGGTEPYAVAKQIVHTILKCNIPLEIDGARVTTGKWLFHEIVASFPELASVFRPDLALGRILYEEYCHSLNVDADAVLAPLHEYRQTDIIVQLARLFGRLAMATPLVFAIDNAQWIDDSSASLMAHFAEISPRSRSAIVATFRSEARYGATGSAARCLADDLRRLGTLALSLDFSAKTEDGRAKRAEFVKNYLDHTFPGNRFPAEFAKRLANHTGANGLFLSETLKYATEKGQIVKSGSSWLLNAQADEMALPESVSSLIQQRIDELGDELREMLVCASVEGDHFTAQVLAKIKGIDEDKVLSQLLDNLQKRHQIVEELGEHEASPDSLVSLFNFRNAMIRHHVYQDLAASQKRRLHKQVGESLEILYGERRFDVASQLAAHFRLAREWTKASQYSIAAARASARIFANREAIRLYQTALELWEFLPEKEISSKCELQFELAEILKRTGQFDEALDLFGRVICSSDCPQRLIARSLNGIGDIHNRREEFEQAQDFYLQCETVGTSIGDREICIEVHTDLAELFRSKRKRDRIDGRFHDAEMSARKADELAFSVVRDGEPEGMWDTLQVLIALEALQQDSEANGSLLYPMQPSVSGASSRVISRRSRRKGRWQWKRSGPNTLRGMGVFRGSALTAQECWRPVLDVKEASSDRQGRRLGHDPVQNVCSLG